MEKITRNVGEFRKEERRAIESVLGEKLREDQQVTIQVITVGGATEHSVPAGEPSDRLPDWCNVYEGLSDEQIAEVEQVALRRSDMSRPSQ